MGLLKFRKTSPPFEPGALSAKKNKRAATAALFVCGQN
jgi:hypothetical protein